jgi:TatD DNase family protein
MIDSHAHLDSCKPPNAELVSAATANGVERILTVGMTSESCRSALAAAEEFPQVWAAVGRHPNEAAGFDDEDLADLEALAAHSRCAAIGETGLDFYRDRTPRADQERAFNAHIELARATGKPLVIHTRAAADETLEILGERAPDLPVILHCFSMPERLDECLAYDRWVISFAGNVTYPAADDLRAAAGRVPDDRILVETDAPYLSPQPVRGRPNEPAHVVRTAEAIAAQRGQSLEELDGILERNAAAVLKW